MKQNKKFILIVAVVLLVSAVVLTACIAAFAEVPREEEDYSAPEGIDTEQLIPEETVTPQNIIKSKFARFEQIDEGVLTLYSEEQFAAVEAKRAQGERFYLTEEEIMYLSNDTIDSYFKYDKIVLTNAKLLPCFEYICDPEWIEEHHFGTHKVEYDGSDAVIKTMHTDKLSYGDEVKCQRQIYFDLTLIMLYRVEMADSGLKCGCEIMRIETNTGRTVNEFVIDTATTKFNGGSTNFDSFEERWKTCRLLIDNGEVEDPEEYSSMLESTEKKQVTYESATRLSYDSTSKYKIFTISVPRRWFISDIGGIPKDEPALKGLDWTVPPENTGAVINNYAFVRGLFEKYTELFAGDEAAETVPLDTEEYVINPGMKYSELVKTYGTPFYAFYKLDGSGKAITNLSAAGGYYVSSDGTVIEVSFNVSLFSSPTEDFSVTEVKTYKPA